jgi:hypothetical protein
MIYCLNKSFGGLYRFKVLLIKKMYLFPYNPYKMVASLLMIQEYTLAV